MQITCVAGGGQKGWCCLMDLNERTPVTYLEQKQILNLFHKQDLIPDSRYRPKGKGV